MLSYAGPELPVRVSLQAFSPFIPLNESNSALTVEGRRGTPSGGGGTMAVLFPEGFTLRAGETFGGCAQF